MVFHSHVAASLLADGTNLASKLFAKFQTTSSHFQHQGERGPANGQVHSSNSAILPRRLVSTSQVAPAFLYSFTFHYCSLIHSDDGLKF